MLSLRSKELFSFLMQSDADELAYLRRAGGVPFFKGKCVWIVLVEDILNSMYGMLVVCMGCGGTY